MPLSPIMHATLIALAGHNATLVIHNTTRLPNELSCAVVNNLYQDPIALMSLSYDTETKQHIVDYQMIEKHSSAAAFSRPFGTKQPQKFCTILNFYKGIEKVTEAVFFVSNHNATAQKYKVDEFYPFHENYTGCKQYLKIGYRGRNFAADSNFMYMNNPPHISPAKDPSKLRHKVCLPPGTRNSNKLKKFKTPPRF